MNFHDFRYIRFGYPRVEGPFRINDYNWPHFAKTMAACFNNLYFFTKTFGGYFRLKFGLHFF
jgi:hypothetical protein